MRALAAAALLVAIGGAPAGAAGGYSGGAGFDNEAVTVWVQVTDANGNVTASPSSPAQLPRLLSYEWIPASNPNGTGFEHLCNAASGPSPSLEEAWGWSYTLITRVASTNVVISSERRCVALLDPADPKRPQPADPSTPPTIGEVWAAVQLPVPALHTSPIEKGITNLQTWFWSDDDRQRAVAVSIDGYTVTGHAELVDYKIDTGIREPTIATAPGSEPHPAARRTYTRKGDYEISITARWHATATMTAPGITTPVTIDLGVAHITTARSYHVGEIRSVLTG